MYVFNRISNFGRNIIVKLTAEHRSNRKRRFVILSVNSKNVDMNSLKRLNFRSVLFFILL